MIFYRIKIIASSCNFIVFHSFFQFFHSNVSDENQRSSSYLLFMVFLQINTYCYKMIISTNINTTYKDTRFVTTDIPRTQSYVCIYGLEYKRGIFRALLFLLANLENCSSKDDESTGGTANDRERGENQSWRRERERGSLSGHAVLQDMNERGGIFSGTRRLLAYRLYRRTVIGRFLQFSR